MSAAEIADNKWEREAAKPPVTAPGSLAQLILVSFFILLFLWILSWTVMGIVGDKKSTMADKYGEMNAADNAPAKKE
ncbi:MAG: hypothetical protein IPK80_12435 [Nannocystis sp.]|jgi:hypothetical protein|nr:hypothetical protein [Nannocystis sp.]